MLHSLEEKKLGFGKERLDLREPKIVPAGPVLDPSVFTAKSGLRIEYFRLSQVPAEQC